LSADTASSPIVLSTHSTASLNASLTDGFVREAGLPSSTTAIHEGPGERRTEERGEEERGGERRREEERGGDRRR
jgi:hypothetical protein